MKLSHWLSLSALLAGLVGCGHSEKSPTSAAAAPVAAIGAAAGGTTAAGPQTPTPKAAVSEFLQAFKLGNDEKASLMLTPLARKMVAQQHLAVAPRGSDTAKFEVGRVEKLGDDGARVYTTLTDVGDNGQPQSDEIIWMVRHVDEGWRIAGVAAPVFKGEPPLLLNFEDEGDIIKKQQMVHEEIRRRMDQQQQGPSAATTAPASLGAAAPSAAAGTSADGGPGLGAPTNPSAPAAATPAAANPTATEGPTSVAPPDSQPAAGALPQAAAQRPAGSEAGVVR